MRRRWQITTAAERTDAVDRAGVTAFRGMLFSRPARQLILGVRPKGDPREVAIGVVSSSLIERRYGVCRARVNQLRRSAFGLETAASPNDMSELPIPPQTNGDPTATELVRVWAAHNRLNISMRLGMWLNTGIDEREAWGVILSDVLRYAANGLSQQNGWNIEETVKAIREALNRNLESTFTMGPIQRMDQGTQDPRNRG